MAAIPKGGTVAVTGAAGFIGSWVVRILLDKGYRVRACVRDVNDDTKCAFLKQMPAYASGRLTLHSANLDDEGVYDDIFQGCHGVAHVSHVSNYNDQDYVKKVCDHIIESVNKSRTVGRVLVTSSIAAVISEMDLTELERRPVCDEDRYPDELNPRRTFDRQGYSMGKVLAQRTFSDAAAENGEWDAITVCPSDNVGPIQSKHQKNFGPWQHNIETMLLGEYSQTSVYRPWATVDVRDDALCHVGLLESVLVKNGERYIAWSTETHDVEDICRDINRLLPELGHKTTPAIDNHPDRLKAREEEFRSLWAKCDFRNDRVRAVTGVEFRPWDVSLRDCVESLITIGEVEPVLREGFSR